MKAISLWQPWASLLVHGFKTIETRSWSTSFRGTLAIHAAKKWSRELEHIAAGEHFVSAVLEMIRKRAAVGRAPANCAVGFGAALPLGAIIGTVEVYDCVPTQTGWWETQIGKLPPQELAFGDYRGGRFGWLCRNPVVFEVPIVCRGHQGFFDVVLPHDRLAASL